MLFTPEKYRDRKSYRTKYLYFLEFAWFHWITVNSSDVSYSSCWIISSFGLHACDLSFLAQKCPHSHSKIDTNFGHFQCYIEYLLRFSAGTVENKTNIWYSAFSWPNPWRARDSIDNHIVSSVSAWKLIYPGYARSS